MSVYACPNCHHVLYRDSTAAAARARSGGLLGIALGIAVGALSHSWNPLVGKSASQIMTCPKCGGRYLNPALLNEPALLPYDEYCRSPGAARRDEDELYRLWHASDMRLKNKEYAISLACAEFDVPARYLPDAFRPLSDAQDDPQSCYYALRITPFLPQSDLEGQYEKRIRELDPVETGLNRDETRSEITKVVQAYNVLKDPGLRRAYDLSYMNLPPDCPVHVIRPVWIY